MLVARVIAESRVTRSPVREVPTPGASDKVCIATRNCWIFGASSRNSDDRSANVGRGTSCVINGAAGAGDDRSGKRILASTHSASTATAAAVRSRFVSREMRADGAITVNKSPADWRQIPPAIPTCSTQRGVLRHCPHVGAHSHTVFVVGFAVHPIVAGYFGVAGHQSSF